MHASVLWVCDKTLTWFYTVSCDGRCYILGSFDKEQIYPGKRVWPAEHC